MNIKTTLLILVTGCCFFNFSAAQQNVASGNTEHHLHDTLFGGNNCIHLPGDFTIDFNACNQFQINFTNNSLYHKTPSWDFGDGTVGNGDSIAHVYQSQGIYTVEMITKNGANCSDTITKQFILTITPGQIFSNKNFNACSNENNRFIGDSTALDNCWSPALYLDSTDIYDPVATPKTNITYQYNEVKKGPNLINNGGFQNGDSLFSSGYIFDSAINTNGYYYITGNSALWDTAFHVCVYDSAFQDTLMLVNGSTVPNTVVWSQKNAVQPYTNYQFIFHGGPLEDVDSLELQVIFNNNEINNRFLLPSLPCDSKKFRITWFSGSDTTLTIKIFDVDTTAALNAFALNNITLNPVYLFTDSLKAQVVAVPVITIGNNASVCLGDSTKLSASVPYSVKYQWSPSAGLSNTVISQPFALPAATTTYYVSVIDSNLCTAKDSVKINVVPAPVLSVLQDTLKLCAGDSVKLNFNAVNANVFTWVPTIHLSSSTIAQPFASPVAATEYSLTVGNGICSTTDSVFINVVSLPVATISNDTSVCKGEILQLLAAGGSAYQWLPPAGLSNSFIANPVATVTNAIKYFVTVTDTNQCKTIDSVSLSINANPVFAVQPVSTSVCYGDSVVIYTTGGNVFSWTPANTVAHPFSASSAVFPLTNTVYQIIIGDTLCHITDSAFVPVTVNQSPTATVSKSNDVDCFLGVSNLTATGGINYSWQPANSLSAPNTSNPVASPSQTTVYYVNVSDANGCIAKDSITVFAYTGSVTNGFEMPSAFTPNGDGKNDCFGVRKWGDVSNLQLMIYNRWGTAVFSTGDPSLCWDGTYKGQQQPAGTYVYYVKAKTICGDVNRKGTVVLIR